MEHSNYRVEGLDYYRNNELSAMDTSRSGEEVVTLQPQSKADGQAMEQDPGSQERERQMDAWMSDIKAFIRSIDISKL